MCYKSKDSERLYLQRNTNEFCLTFVSLCTYVHDNYYYYISVCVCVCARLLVCVCVCVCVCVYIIYSDMVFKVVIGQFLDLKGNIWLISNGQINIES